MRVFDFLFRCFLSAGLLGLGLDDAPLSAASPLPNEERLSLLEMMEAPSLLPHAKLNEEVLLEFQSSGAAELLHPWVEVLSISASPEVLDSGRLGEFLMPHVFYSQVGNFESEEIERLKKEWREAQKRGADCLVLDLRTRQRSEDPSAFLSFLEAFAEANRPLYRSVRDGAVLEVFTHQTQPFWRDQIAVLVDESSSDTARFLACLLHHHAKAWVMGHLQVKETYAYVSMELSESRRALLAEAKLRIEMERHPTQYLSPRVVPLTSDPEGREAWRKEGKRSLRSLSFETSPRRFDEKALIEGKNPDFDAALDRPRSITAQQAPRDRALVQALDLILARRFLKADKLALPAGANGGNMFELPKDP